MNINVSDSGVGIGENHGNVYINLPPPITKPSILAKVVKALSAAIGNTPPANKLLKTEYEIDAKIEFNFLVKHRYLIQSYGEYGSHVESIYATIDTNRPGEKGKILGAISIIYQEVLGELLLQNKDVEKMEIIRNNSDGIVDKVLKAVGGIINSSTEMNSITQEDIILCTRYIVAHAFIECKVLEEPK